MEVTPKFFASSQIIMAIEQFMRLGRPVIVCKLDFNRFSAEPIVYLGIPFTCVTVNLDQ